MSETVVEIGDNESPVGTVTSFGAYRFPGDPALWGTLTEQLREEAIH